MFNHVKFSYILKTCTYIFKFWTLFFTSDGNLTVSFDGAWQIKEPLVSKLMTPHASPLYRTGDNIFMKYKQVPFQKEVTPLTDFSEEQSYPCLIPSMFLLLLTTS